MARGKSQTATKQKTPPEKLQEAAQYEEAIMVEAQEIWAKNVDDSGRPADLLVVLPQLYPLLRKPIHVGHIETIPNITGKPYDSTGIRSVQVQHDRMNNVLGPTRWSESVDYHEDGKLCHVTVVLLGDFAKDQTVLMARSSWGGVDRGSTLGNVYKGSYTNAAKVAFARIGPGHEVYVGAVDLDPDVSQAAAEQQAKTSDVKPLDTISAEDANAIRDQFDAIREQCDPTGLEQFMDEFRMECGRLGIAGGKWHLLTPSQAAALSGWLSEKETT